MLDRRLSAWIKPGIDRIAKQAANIGFSANALTFLGFALGMGAARATAVGMFLWGIFVLREHSPGFRFRQPSAKRSARRLPFGGFYGDEF
jgi:hypothetical protein